MTKKEWNEVYEKLHNIYYEFILAYADYQNGKTHKIKEEGIKKCYLMIDKTLSILTSNIETEEFLFGENPNEMKKVAILEDFRKPQYFDRDMNHIIEKIYKLT